MYWLKRIFARKELEENQLWRMEWYIYDRWLCQFKDVELMLKNMRAQVEGGDCLTVDRLRAEMIKIRENIMIPVSDKAYALRDSQGYWIGVWNDRKIAEDVRNKTNTKEEILMVQVIPEGRL